MGRDVTVDRPLRLVAKFQRDYNGLIIFTVLGVLAGAGLYAYRVGWLVKRAGTRMVITDEKQDTAEVSVEELKHELETVEEKIRKYREYLSKLEEKRKKGEVTDLVYIVLKDTYSKELEKHEEELKTIKEKLDKTKNKQ